MKSSNKQITGLRRSLTRRAVSSQKQSQQPTPRTRYDQTSALGKSNTVRLLSAKPAKVNNYLLDMATFQKMLANPKIVAKKRAVRTQQRNIYEQLLLKKSDKMKLIFWNQDPNLMQLKPLILSADIIVNQDCFWDQGEENKQYEWRHGKAQKDQFIKEWKTLHKGHFVIWIIRNRKSWARVQAAVSGASLPVHGLFLLKRKRNYTVDFTSVFRQIQKQRDTAFSSLENRSSSLRLSQIFSEDSLTIFQTVKVNTKDVAVYDSYLGKIPVLLNKKAKVVLLRTENDPPGLDCVLRCLDKCHKPLLHGEESASYWRLDKIGSARRLSPELFLCPAITNFVYQYLSSLLNEEEQQLFLAKEGPDQDWFYQQQEIDTKIGEMKADLIQSLISSHGRNYQFEGGLSIYNFVGEMFKRNHKIIFDQLVESQYFEERKPAVRPKSIKPMGEVDLRLEFYQMEWM